MTWAEACNDKRLQNLPYKIEITRQGKLILSRINNRHSILQSLMIPLLHDLMPENEIICECAIETSEGMYVADVGSTSAERFKMIKEETGCSIAPEVCVEVWTPTTTSDEIKMKCRLYLEKGAEEFWYCDAEGRLTHFDKSGELGQSKLCPRFPRQIA